MRKSYNNPSLLRASFAEYATLGMFIAISAEQGVLTLHLSNYLIANNSESLFMFSRFNFIVG